MNISSLINIKKWIDCTFIEQPCEKNKSFIYNLCKIFLRYIIIQIKVKIFNRKNLHVYLMDSINYTKQTSVIQFVNEIILKCRIIVH